MSEQIFSIRCPTNIQFGAGTAVASLSAIAELGRRALLIHGASPGRAQWLVDGLTEQGLALSFASCPREPDIELIEACVEVGRGAGVELVIGVGGGAVIDTAKAVAGLIPAQGQVMDYLEVVGGGQPLAAHPLPWVALPTTAGTGAEVTRNAVIDVPRSRRKVSLRDDRLLPTLAIVDPDLTAEAPRSVVLASGLDAITQVIEPYISGEASRFTDALCRDGIATGLPALMRLLDQSPAAPESISAAREQMAWVSLCGGLALANAKLGAVHGLAGPLGGILNAPHGAIAGCLLPAVLAANQAHCQSQPDTAARIAEVELALAQALAVDRHEAFSALAAWSSRQGLPGLKQMGLAERDCRSVAEAAQTSSSMRGNPVKLSVATLEGILRRS